MISERGGDAISEIKVILSFLRSGRSLEVEGLPLILIPASLSFLFSVFAK